MKAKSFEEQSMTEQVNLSITLGEDQQGEVAVKEEPQSPSEDNNLDDIVEDEHESSTFMPFEQVFIKQEGHTNFGDATLELAVKQECGLSDDTTGGNIADNIRSRFLQILGKESGTQLVCDAAPNVKSETGSQQLIDGPGFTMLDSRSSPCRSESPGERANYSDIQIDDEKHEETGEMDYNLCVNRGSVCRKLVTSYSNVSNRECLTMCNRSLPGEKPFHCTVRKNELMKRGSLIPHVRYHSEKPFQCSICKKEFTQRGSLIRHKRYHTGVKPFKCSVCRKAFTQKSSLIRHERYHTGEKPFQCYVCKKVFAENGNLISHMRTHTGEKPFQCSVCKKEFSQKGHLISHMKHHTDKNPFQCSVCSKQFTRNFSLTQHMRYHTGEKPFQCYVCKKNCTQKGYLISHMRTHTSEKPFQCSVCKKVYKDKSSLTRHMRNHTGENSFQCSVCEKDFPRKCYLISHMRYHTHGK